MLNPQSISALTPSAPKFPGAFGPAGDPPPNGGNKRAVNGGEGSFARLLAEQNTTPIGPPGREPSVFVDPLRPIQNAMMTFREKMQQFDAAEASLVQEHGGSSPELTRLLARRNAEMLGMQLQVQEAAFRMELTSKVIENASTGTRKVLETQV